ncbi:hypothetical protein [Vibrio owensii]|uniref:hypothetical protein n=1 Tax=Vibrio owensii TaxID=696485 RepID=UPI003CC5CADC
MSLRTEIDFLKNGLLEFPMVVGHSNVEIDFETAITTNKFFDEHIAVEVAGDIYDFTAKGRSECWSYINEGEGTFYSLNSVDDYHLHCDTFDYSCLVEVRQNRNYLDEDTNPFEDELSHVRMERVKRKMYNSGLSYCAKHHSDLYQDKNDILSMALAAHVAALGDKQYKRNWKEVDRWHHSFATEHADVERKLFEAIPSASSFVVAKVTVEPSNVNVFSRHIAHHNPNFDMNLMHDTCAVLKTIDKCNNDEDRANELKTKTLDLLGKFDRDTQRNMIRLLKSSLYPKLESFVERSYTKVFEPKRSASPEPSL